MTARQFAAALERLGLSQVRAAQLLGTTQASVSRWSTGDTPVPGPVVAALTAWLRHGLPT